MKHGWHTQFKRTPKELRTHNKIVFDSALEMRTYKCLLTMVEDGEIKDLKVHVQHLLILPNGVPIKNPSGRTAYYTSDFEWTDCKTDKHVIADCKGFMDRHAKFRIAVFEAIKGIKVMIVKK